MLRYALTGFFALVAAVGFFMGNMAMIIVGAAAAVACFLAGKR